MTRDKIADYLIKDGLSPHMSSFFYLIRAIELFDVENPRQMMLIYKKISDEYGSTPRAIERSITYAFIKAGINKRNRVYIARANAVLCKEEEI